MSVHGVTRMACLPNYSKSRLILSWSYSGFIPNAEKCNVYVTFLWPIWKYVFKVFSLELYGRAVSPAVTVT